MNDPSAQREANCSGCATRALPLVLVVLLSTGCGEDAAAIDASTGVDAAADGDADGDTDADTDADAGPEPCDEQGATRTVACGFCGTQSQICAADGLWRDDGDCQDPGECEPGALDEEACGVCGTHERLCSASCDWNEWSECEEQAGAECTAGVQEATREGCEPGDIQERRCSDSCRWESIRECGPECIGEPQGVGTDAEEICIPGGPFIMGGADPDETTDDPEHEVILYPYFIGRWEVTNERYHACVDAGVCTDPSYYIPPVYTDEAARRFPVLNLDPDQARIFCEWVAMRVPTEAEWEKAARGPSPDRRIYPWGDERPTCAEANHETCGVSSPDEDIDAHPAGASPFGVERMADGAWEPCADWWDRDYYEESPEVDPRGDDQGEEHTYRSWGDGVSRTSFPTLTEREPRNRGGVRCVRSAEER